MIRNYIFEWYSTKESKYKEPIHRFNTVNLTSPSGETAVDAKSALNIFTSSFGNLKNITIVKIKEMDENGQIGEDITPSDENTIIPSGR